MMSKINLVKIFKTKTNLRSEDGFTLIAALMLTIVMGLILAAYNMLANIDLKSAKSSIDYHSSAYSAEAGLNIRAEEIRSSLINGQEVIGTGPTELEACEGANLGAGDFVCQDYVLGKQRFTTYVTQEPGAVVSKPIPVGEPFSGLLATETTYTLNAFARSPTTGDRIGTVLKSKIRARQVPLFQFAAFYDKDLEFEPGNDMVISGPIHTNRDLYLAPDKNLLINGQITIGGNFYKGNKYESLCQTSPNSQIHINKNLPVSLPPSLDIDSYQSHIDFITNFITLEGLPSYSCSGSSLTSLEDQDFSEWNDNVHQQISQVNPPPKTYNAVGPGHRLWDLADARIALKLDNTGILGIEVQDVNQIKLDTDTDNIINNCGNVLDYTSPIAGDHFWDQMRQQAIIMLEVDVEGLLTCLDSQGIVSYDNSSDDGHIIFFTIDHEDDDTTCTTQPCHNNYGIRYKNGANLFDLDPNLNGLTLATDQPVYLLGDFNLDNGGGNLPASLYGDSLFLLSNNWTDAYDANTRAQQAEFEGAFNAGVLTGITYTQLLFQVSSYLSGRQAVDTTYNAALVFGTTTTGGADGPSAQGNELFPANPRGGIVNYARLYEQWGPSRTLTIKGSFVSLDQQWRVESKDHRGVNVGVFPPYHYTAPQRDFSFDTMFSNPNNQPPGALSFVYLTQEFYSQDF